MRIEQNSNFLMSMVRDVAAGRVMPAAMQRPYVWTCDDVEALVDSIISGFPIGGFLLWEPGRKADISKLAKNRLGPLHAASEDAVTAATPYYLLLDGQNRLATIAWMLQRKIVAPPDASEAERNTWLNEQQLVLDWKSKTVCFVPAGEATSGLRLPAWTLVAGGEHDFRDAMTLVREKYGDWANSGYSDNEINEFLKLWDVVCQKFRDARTTDTIIIDATPEEARHAFTRICRVGVPMAAEDFDKAICWTPA